MWPLVASSNKTRLRPSNLPGIWVRSPLRPYFPSLRPVLETGFPHTPRFQCSAYDFHSEIAPLRHVCLLFVKQSVCLSVCLSVGTVRAQTVSGIGSGESEIRGYVGTVSCRYMLQNLNGWAKNEWRMRQFLRKCVSKSVRRRPVVKKFWGGKLAGQGPSNFQI